MADSAITPGVSLILCHSVLPSFSADSTPAERIARLAAKLSAATVNRTSNSSGTYEPGLKLWAKLTAANAKMTAAAVETIDNIDVDLRSIYYSVRKTGFNTKL